MGESNEFYDFFKYIECSDSGVATDAFMTFKYLMTRHEVMIATFLEENFEKFFDFYHKFLSSSNYVTKRESVKFLGEILLKRNNFSVMEKYVLITDYLKLIMNIFREDSKQIQFEAFHVFKIFVANPNKSKQISNTLFRNKVKLIDYLSKLGNERYENDSPFQEEKQFIIDKIEETTK